MWRAVLTILLVIGLFAANVLPYRRLSLARQPQPGDILVLPRIPGLKSARFGAPWEALRVVMNLFGVHATPAALKPARFGLEGLLSDLLWLRGIKYIHDEFDEIERARKEGRRPSGLYRQFGPLYDTITDLDPYFIEGYRYGAIFLTVLGRNQDAAIALLKKGLRCPEIQARWELNYDLGTLYFLEKNDFDTAADYFRAAAEDVNAPDFVPHVASYFLRVSKHEYAISFWQRRLETRNEEVRRIAKIEIGKLVIEQAADLFKQLEGRHPSDMKELLKPGPLAKLPEPQARKYFERTVGRPPKDLAELQDKLRNTPFVKELPKGPGDGYYMINSKTGKVVYVEEVKGEKETKR